MTEPRFKPKQSGHKTHCLNYSVLPKTAEYVPQAKTSTPIKKKKIHDVSLHKFQTLILGVYECVSGEGEGHYYRINRG